MNIKETLQNTLLSPLDAEILLFLAANMPKEYLFAHPEHKLSSAELKKFNSFAKRRRKGEPIAYLTGKKEFYGLEFEVNKNVLIPRPETELIVELATKKILDTKYPPTARLAKGGQIPDTIIDVGTGSGNIVISIVKNLPAAARKKINFYAADISKKALLIAEKNAKKHEVAKYIKFIKSDLLEFVNKKKIEGNIMIIANLPYVSDSLYKKNKHSLKYEPKTALISKSNGLDHYFRLFNQIKQIYVMSYALCVTCYVEIGPEQKNRLARIVKRELPTAKIKFFKDLSGRTRIAIIGVKPRTKLTKIHKS